LDEILKLNGVDIREQRLKDGRSIYEKHCMAWEENKKALTLQYAGSSVDVAMVVAVVNNRMKVYLVSRNLFKLC
jgi:hypothetical protein